eukprot:TRINITY_DN8147_c0_g1_i1.p1 TRINITY_DN8147_c0_g1~~TRINITY_DN8147_c0_g1_i1.p1  ORF type:complete len:607 (+),score=118.11 TRINITY_DN8147_c0_g1_i1:151-1971(+)
MPNINRNCCLLLISLIFLTVECCKFRERDTQQTVEFELTNADEAYRAYLETNPGIVRADPREVGLTVGLAPGEDIGDDRVNMLGLSLWQFVFHDLVKHAVSGTKVFEWNCTDGTGPDPYCGKSITGENSFVVGVSAMEVNEDGEAVPVNEVLVHRNEKRQLLDLSNLYGALDSMNQAIREMDGSGKLKTGSYNVCPYPPPPPFVGECNRTVQLQGLIPTFDQTGIYVGNIFGWPNEDLPTLTDYNINVVLPLHMHYVVFLRNHNRLAEMIKTAKPNWSESRVYRTARLFNVRAYDIVVKELMSNYLRPEHQFDIEDLRRGRAARLPTNLVSYAARMLGHDGYQEWKVYNKNKEAVTVVPPSFSQVFPNVPVPCPECNIMGATPGPEQHKWGLTAMLVHNNNITEPTVDGDIDNTFRSLMVNPAGKIDGRISWVIERLGEGFVPQPVFSLGIDRARSENLATYYYVRKEYFEGEYADIYENPNCTTSGTNDDSIECFYTITQDLEKAQTLKDLYGSVKNIDTEVGLASESHPDTYMPFTMSKLISQQLKRAYKQRIIHPEDCIEHFYEDLVSLHEDIESLSTYADLISRNIRGLEDIADVENSFVPF